MPFQPHHRWSALSSVALHGLILALLMRIPEPIPERPPEVEVTIELPPPKPRTKVAKADHKRQPDKKRPAKKPRKAEPHTLEARWEPDKATVKPPESASPVKLPAVKIEPEAVTNPAPAAALAATARPAAPESSNEAPTPEQATTPLQPAPVATAATKKSAETPAEAPAAAATARTEGSDRAGEGGELSLPSSASSQTSRSGSTGLDMAAAERPGALAHQANSGSASLSQSAQRASAADVEPGRQLRAADTASTAQPAEHRASTGGGGAALSGQSRRASAAGQEPTDPRPLRVAGSGSPAAVKNAPAGGQDRGAQLAATPQTARGAMAGAAAGPTSTTTRNTAALGLAEAPPGARTLAEGQASLPGMVMSWARGRSPGGYSVTPPVPVGVDQMKMATALAPRATTGESGGASAPAWQSTAQRAGAPLPGEGKTIRMEAVEVGPARIGLDTGRFATAPTPGSSTSKTNPSGGAGGTGSDAESSQAGLRASASPVSGQAGGLAQASGGQRTQAAAQDSAMAGLETTAANTFCKLPDANETNLLKAAKGAPRLIKGAPMFNPVWVPPGKLILRVHVLANGEPDQVLVKESSGSNILDDEAVKQIRSALFQPGERNGRTTDYWVDLPITYNKPGFFGFGGAPN